MNNNAEARRKWDILCGFRREKGGFKRPKVGKKQKQKNLLQPWDRATETYRNIISVAFLS
ncbi:hypothetical protein [Clostridium sp.]|uniref:hypothetical protein n=1 Tax=Clostridium sp. TaxID=1506 RepID=UPI00261091F2|nr:hypothetical protein [uncultured Clostridium sp.]